MFVFLLDFRVLERLSLDEDGDAVLVLDVAVGGEADGGEDEADDQAGRGAEDRGDLSVGDEVGLVGVGDGRRVGGADVLVDAVGGVERGDEFLCGIIELGGEGAAVLQPGRIGVLQVLDHAVVLLLRGEGDGVVDAVLRLADVAEVFEFVDDVLEVRARRLEGEDVFLQKGVQPGGSGILLGGQGVGDVVDHLHEERDLVGDVGQLHLEALAVALDLLEGLGRVVVEEADVVVGVELLLQDVDGVAARAAGLVVGLEAVDVGALERAPGVALAVDDDLASGVELDHALVEFVDTVVLALEHGDQGAVAHRGVVVRDVGGEVFVRDVAEGGLQDVVEEGVDEAVELLLVGEVARLGRDDVGELLLVDVLRRAVAVRLRLQGDAQDVVLGHLRRVELAVDLVALLVEGVIDHGLHVADGDDVVHRVGRAVEIGDGGRVAVVVLLDLHRHVQIDAGRAPHVVVVPPQGDEEVADDGEDQGDAENPVFEGVGEVAVVAPREMAFPVVVVVLEDDHLIMLVRIHVGPSLRTFN